MFQLTERAGATLMVALVTADAPEELRIRLLSDSDGFSLGFDVEKYDDDVYAIDGQRVLIMDPASAQELANATLDMRGMRFCLVSQQRLPLGWTVPPNFDPSLN